MNIDSILKCIVVLASVTVIVMMIFKQSIDAWIDQKMERARQERGWTPEMVEVLIGTDPVAQYLWNQLGTCTTLYKPYANAKDEYKSAWEQRRLPEVWAQAVVHKHREEYAAALEREARRLREGAEQFRREARQRQSPRPVRAKAVRPEQWEAEVIRPQ